MSEIVQDEQPGKDPAQAVSTPVSNKRWYVVHAYSGMEKSVQRALMERVERAGMQDQFGQILVPTEEVVEVRNGQKSVTERRFFPGYVLVEMEMTDETWHLVKNSAKVTGFIGGSAPKAVSEAEVQKVTQQMAQGAEKPKAKASFSIGDSVTVVDGPFSNFNGTVEEINEEKAKVKVSVSIFGRPTPVELDFIQVDKN